MSWFINIPEVQLGRNGSLAPLEDKVNELIDAHNWSTYAKVTDESREQAQSALGAILELAGAMPVGAIVKGHISGHANPGNAHVNGFSDPTITASLTLVPVTSIAESTADANDPQVSASNVVDSNAVEAGASGGAVENS